MKNICIGVHSLVYYVMLFKAVLTRTPSIPTHNSHNLCDLSLPKHIKFISTIVFICGIMSL